MNTIGTFYRPEEMDYASVVPAYQAAFAEEPWNEVSKCMDVRVPQRCPGGLSSVEVGANCFSCNQSPDQPAYESNELIARFTELGESRPTLWYVETVEARVALAAVCWLSDAKRLAQEKYQDVPAMEPWLGAIFGERPFVYLDEIFRDKTVRPAGNLANFGTMVAGFWRALQNDTLAYRSKNSNLLAKTERTFGSAATIARAERQEAPDWRERSFAIVCVGGTL